MKKTSFWHSSKRHSMFLICFWSYLLLLLYSVAFSVYNYTTFWDEFKRQQLQYDQIIFHQLDEMVSGKLTRVDALLIDVITDVDIMRTFNVNDLKEKQQLGKTLTAGMRLRSYYNKSNLSQAYIYYRDADAIIMGDRYYSPYDFFSKFIDDGETSFDQWKSVLNQKKFRKIENSMSAVNPTTMLSMYHTVQNGRSAGAQIVIDFDLEDVCRAFNESITSDMAFFISDENFNTLFSYGESGINAEGNAFYLEPYTSDRSGWTYHSAVSAELYYKGLHEIVRQACLVMAVEILLGVFLCLFMAYSNSMPIRKLYHKLFKNGSKNSESQNEYYLVNSYFDELIAEKDDLMQQYKQAMKNNLLQSVLSGTLSLSGTPLTYLESFGIYFNYSEFQIVTIRLEHASKGNSPELEEQSIIKLHMLTELKERIPQHLAVYSVDMSWNQLCLIINGDALENYSDKLYYALDEIKNHYRDSNLSHLTVGIGGVHSSYEHIFVSCQESIAALEYQIIRRHGSVSTYKDVLATSQSTYYPIINSVQIKANIRSGDANGAIDALNGIISDIFSKSGEVSLDVAKSIFLDIMSIGLSVLSEIEIPTDEQSLYKTMLFECKTIERLQNRLQQIFSEMCASVLMRKRSHSQKLFDRICSYIDEHYTDQSFSLVQTADYFEITAPYLSSFFKEKTGVNFLDYITGKRLAKAKELIAASKSNIGDIALSVGYSSSGSFIRAFKKAEGVTPTLYREQHSMAASM